MNASNKRRNVEKDCGVYLRAAFIRGRRLMIFLLVLAAFIRVITVVTLTGRKNGSEWEES